MAVEIKGLAGVNERLDGIVNIKTIEKAITNATLLVERAAKQNAQAVSDNIAGTISSRIEGTTGIVFTPLFYAPYVEYGTGIEAKHPDIPGRQDVPWVYVEHSGRESGNAQKSYTLEKAEQTVAYLRSKGLPAHYTYGQKPRPYMRPALDDNRKEVLAKLREGIIDG